jgi:peptidoglycan hydrolase-like amidase
MAGSRSDAFFYSTCGGTTAEAPRSFRAADRPYLRSIADVGPDGAAYCSISPALPLAGGVDRRGPSG